MIFVFSSSLTHGHRQPCRIMDLGYSHHGRLGLHANPGEHHQKPAGPISRGPPGFVGDTTIASHIVRLSFAKPPPEGPVLAADIERCLGEETLYLTRRPSCRTGHASWTVLLAVFHPCEPRSNQLQRRSGTRDVSQEADDCARRKEPPVLDHSIPVGESQTAAGPAWHQRLEKTPLTFHKEVACTTISRTTLIVFVILSCAGEAYRCDGPAGLRLGTEVTIAPTRSSGPLANVLLSHSERLKSTNGATIFSQSVFHEGLRSASKCSLVS